MKHLSQSLILQYFNNLKIGGITNSFVFLFFVVFIIIGGFGAIFMQFLLFGSPFTLSSLIVNINSYILTFSISLFAESFLSERENSGEFIKKILRKGLFVFVICFTSTTIVKLCPSYPIISLVMNILLIILLWHNWLKESLNDSRITSFDQILTTQTKETHGKNW